MSSGGGFPPIRKDFEGLQTDIMDRVVGQERRRSKPVPGRLGPNGQEITDWNLALSPGFYYGLVGALNAPGAGSWQGYVTRTDNRIVQVAFRALSTEFYQPMTRYWDGTAWGAWRAQGYLDTGAVTISGNFSDAVVTVRAVGPNALMRGTINTDIATGTGSVDVTSSAVATQWRPTGIMVGSGYVSGMSVAVFLRPDGSVAVGNRNAIAITAGITFTIAYMLG
jgi:hypothetical protein